MLTIRPEQMASFNAEARQRFEGWLLEHVHTWWPDRVARIGDDSKLRLVLREAVARATGFGIESSANLARYVNLVMLLGPGFPDDSRIPWAGGILRAEALAENHKLRVLNQLLEAEGLDEPEPTWGWP